jgi:hypothetical protein
VFQHERRLTGKAPPRPLLETNADGNKGGCEWLLCNALNGHGQGIRAGLARCWVGVACLETRAPLRWVFWCQMLRGRFALLVR